jgi:molybdopterin-guanine dinucleotide biosynthesis protein A
LDRSGIVLAIGSQGAFSEDKGTLKLENKPLLNYVVGGLKGLVDEVIIVVDNEQTVETYSKFASSNARFIVEDSGDLLAAIVKGFEAAQGDYVLLWPFDSPFVSKDVVSLLFDCGVGKTAIILRTPDGEIEPLHAVYQKKVALEAAKAALENNELDFNAVVCKLQGVRYVSTLVLEQIDPDLRTFLRINTPSDLKKATLMLKPRRTKK